MFRFIALVALLSTAATAAPAPTSPNPTLQVLSAFHSLDADGSFTVLSKRQSQTTALNGLEDLLTKGLAASRDSGSTCYAQCGPWVSKITDCAGRSTNYAIGVCACGSDEVSSMEVCGNCFGSDSQTDATDFGSLCRANGVGVSSSSASRTSTSSTRSSTSLVSRASASASAAAGGGGFSSGFSAATSSAGGSFGGLNDVASSAGIAAGPSASASGSTGNAAGGTSDAGAVKVAAGMVAGAVGGVMLVFAL